LARGSDKLLFSCHFWGKIDGKCQGQDKVKVTSGTITEIIPNLVCA